MNWLQDSSCETVISRKIDEIEDGGSYLKDDKNLMKEKTALLLPELSSSYYPQKAMPPMCSHPIVEKYIRGFENGTLTFENIEPDESVQDKRLKTMDLNGNIVESNGNPYDSPVGYVWKQLCDSPLVIGITRGIKSDHDPHYHPESECYYVISGTAKTLCNNQYIDLHKGDYFYIPGNTIHNTPILSENSKAADNCENTNPIEQVCSTETDTPNNNNISNENNDNTVSSEIFSVLYWFPMNQNFSTFQYYWKRNTTDPEILLRFQKVDEIRKRDLQLDPYGTKPTS